MDALNWRKASYSASNGGGCVEVGQALSAVVVRDTQDRTGLVLRFSAGAWRRFADQVKRSLPPGPYRGSRTCYRGTLGVGGCPAACRVVFLAGRRGLRRGVGAAAGWFPWAAGSVRYASRLWCAERALGRGKAGEGPGNRETGLWGVSGFPWRASHFPDCGSFRIPTGKDQISGRQV
jgi:hypothetical protein